MTYYRDGVALSERKHGEGVFKWIDADNLIYDRLWYRVERVHEESGRVAIYRYHLEDDGVIYCERRDVAPGPARLKHRPAGKERQAAELTEE